LHAVGIRFAVVGCIREMKVRLCRCDHTHDSLKGSQPKEKCLIPQV
jgi:hypothetical protein